MKMTEKEILNEMEICKTNFEQLHKELETEEDKTIRFSKLDEMLQIANRMSELDTLYKKHLLKEYKSNCRKLAKSIIKAAFKERFKKKH